MMGFELNTLSDPVYFLWDFSLSLFGIDGLCLLWHFRVTCCHIICEEFQLLVFHWGTTFLCTSPLTWSTRKLIFFSACLVARLLNSHYVPFPVVQNYIFLKLSSLNPAYLTALHCLSLFLLESKLVKLASSSQ